ncbi:hypothetical protein NCTGTJJY_CDS0017 [Serratia phage 92A1]|nr:hypothetical protein NCTGTJJY_CDS0017 [Serratia phage 92A1]
MYIVCYKDSDGFVLPCVDVTFKNVLVFESHAQAEEALQEHKLNLSWLLAPERETKHTWYGKKYVVQTPRALPNRPRVMREFNTAFVKKGRIVL